MLAGQIGRRQQFAVSHAAAPVQVGAVVPFAHALTAQADLYGVQATVEAYVATRGFHFISGEGGWPGRGADALAQFLKCQLLIKTGDAGNACQQALCFGTVRLTLG